MADIIPENNYNPSLAEDLKWVEIDKDTLPHIEGKFGNYPRYAELIYNISAGSSSSASYNDLKSKPKINGIELYGNKTSSELKLLGQDSIQNTIDDNADDEHIPSSLAVKNYINQQVTDLYKFKGSKATYEELPAEGNKVGDVWNVAAAHGTTPAGTNYAWTGAEWDALGGNIDLSNYQEKLTAGTGIIISADNIISATGGTTGTVTSVNGQTPGDDGNVSLTTTNIPNLSLTSGENNTAVITIGETTLNALTNDSLVDGSKITGTVPNATSAIKDKDNNDITTTYAKNVDLTNLTSIVETKQDISNLVTEITPDATDTTYPSTKAVLTAVNNSVTINEYSSLTTTNKTIVGAINEIFNKDNSLSDTSKVVLSAGSTTGLLLMPNGDNYVKPEINQFVDYKIKIFAKSFDNTKFEKYSVNFFAINNNDTLTITSSPTCESVSFYGGSLINNVDVKSDTEDSTKIQFSVTTNSDNVVLYTSLNKTIINNII